MDEKTAIRRGGRVEGRIRRGLEMFLLAAALVLSVGVIGGCAVVGLGAGVGPGMVIGGLAAGLLLAGVVYLATSMSRDVRILKQRLLEREQRTSRRSDSDGGL